MNKEEFDKIELIPDHLMSKYIKRQQDYEWFYAPMGNLGEHYTLLSSLSRYFNDAVLYDLGTHRGLSALALATNPNNKVVSYDIENYLNVDNPGNIDFRIGNFFEDLNIFESPLIMMDIDPHDGMIERKAIDWLADNDYKGVLVMDDINLNPDMRNLWESISLEKYDITDKGHWSGTGIVFF